MARIQEDTVLSERVEARGADEQSNVPGMSLLDLVLNSLQDDKAEDVVTLDLAGKSPLADYMVVASGRSSRQIIAMSEKLSDRLKQGLGVICRMEGKVAGDWVLVDCGDVIVHLFRPEVREFYQLEKMWQPLAEALG